MSQAKPVYSTLSIWHRRGRIDDFFGRMQSCDGGHRRSQVFGKKGSCIDLRVPGSADWLLGVRRFFCTATKSKMNSISDRSLAGKAGHLD
jgi:hypothetical protein